MEHHDKLALNPREDEPVHVPVKQQPAATTVRLPSDPQAQKMLQAMNRGRLPYNLKMRLVEDMACPGHYNRMQDINNLDLLQPNSSYCCSTFPFDCCSETILVQDGYVGLAQLDSDFHFLAPGYHKFSTCGNQLHGEKSLNLMDSPVVNGPTGFVTISEGRLGLLQVMGDFKLLAPGTYQWTSSAVFFVGSVDITAKNCRLGPYTLVTVPEGDVAITFNNGELVVLGMANGNGESRTYFLDDPKWQLGGFLSLQNQTDRLEGNDLLSKDNVELIMVAMSQWRVVDPQLAVTQCGTTMSEIREKVNALVRAAIARIVAGTNIGNGPVAGGMAQPLVVAQAVTGGVVPPPKAVESDADLAHLMQSEQATRHMGELIHNMERMGIEVVGVFVPEKRMKNDDIRKEVARQAVIGIKADAERSSADASAYATITSAKAEAQAVLELAKAHSEAGALLGAPTETAARLALTEKTAQSLKDAKVTIFSGSPGNMPFMLNAQPGH